MSGILVKEFAGGVVWKAETGLATARFVVTPKKRAAPFGAARRVLWGWKAYCMVGIMPRRIPGMGTSFISPANFSGPRVLRRSSIACKQRP